MPPACPIRRKPSQEARLPGRAGGFRRERWWVAALLAVHVALAVLAEAVPAPRAGGDAGTASR
jgi:hypothetical protein